jgi:hypothetical protein
MLLHPFGAARHSRTSHPFTAYAEDANPRDPIKLAAAITDFLRKFFLEGRSLLLSFTTNLPSI